MPCASGTSTVISFRSCSQQYYGRLPLGNTLQVATLRQKFGRRLREIRAQRRMTQEQFAETLDVCVDFPSPIERGKNAPSFETLDRMAKRLRMSVADLFTFNSGPVG